MNLEDVILNITTINPDAVLYAKRINGQLLPSSEIVLLEFTDEDLLIGKEEVAKKKYPDFSYCIEVFLVQEMIEDLESLTDKMGIDEKVDRLIKYIDYDA